MYFQKVLTILPLLTTISNPQPPKSTCPIYLPKDCDDNTKFGGLVVTIIILHAIPVACASISPLSYAHMHRAIFYRVVQQYNRYAE